MKLKSGIVIEKTGDEYVAVATGEEGHDPRQFREAQRLNIRAVDEHPSGLWLEQLVDALLEHYDVSREKAQADVHALVVKIREAGLIDG